MKTLKKKSCISVTKCPQWWGPGDPKEALWTSSITCELVRNADAGPTPQICLIRTCIFTSAPVTCLTCSSLKKLCHGTFLGPTCWAKLLQSCPILHNSMDCSPPGSSVHEDSPGKNTGVGCRFLLQGIFPTQGLDPSLPHCRQIHYRLSQYIHP